MMAPDPRLAPGGWRKFAKLSQAPRRRGSKSFVDVVFNHTGEGDEFGPTVSFRGLGQRQLLPARRRPRALRERLRLRQYSRLRSRRLSCGSSWMRCAPGRSMAASTAFASISRRRSRVAPSGFDRDAPLLSAISAGPAAARVKAHRRTLGHGPRRLSARRLSRRLRRMERSLSRLRRDASGAATTCGVAELATRFSGSPDVFCAQAPVAQRQFHHGA